MVSVALKNKIIKELFGSSYDLSVVFVDSEISRQLNKTYRGKDKATNVLSFPLAKDAGEIILCQPQIEAEAKLLDKNPAEHALYLFIHGALHLKGFSHGSKMEAKERELINQYFTNGQNHHRRIRHRDNRNSSGGLRSR